MKIEINCVRCKAPMSTEIHTQVVDDQPSIIIEEHTCSTCKASFKIGGQFSVDLFVIPELPSDCTGCNGSCNGCGGECHSE